MDSRLRESLIMAAVAAIVAVAASLICWIVIDDGHTREVLSLAALAGGYALGIAAVIILRKRDIFYRPADNACEKLRQISTSLSFLAVVPALMALISHAGFDVDIDDFPILSMIMVFVSMLVQAVFWRKAVDIGYLSFISNALFALSLILLNIGAIIFMNNGGSVMLAASVFAMLAPVIIMYNWERTADIVLTMSILAAVLCTASMVLDDSIRIGELVVSWIPVLIILALRNRLKASYLVCDGQRLF